MSLFAELKRRNVVRVGLAYIVIGWVLAQIAEFAFENFGAPDWVLKSIVVVLLLGLPLALFFAWAFEMTPEGLKREEDVDRSQSITHSTGRKLDFVIIGVLVVALAYFALDRGTEIELIDSPEGTAVVDESDTEDANNVSADEPIVRSIAVLPFINMSSDKEQEWFSDGLTEELLNALARTPDLLVAARTSSFKYKGSSEDIPTIANALGVAHVLEGSVRRGGDQLRVTAQLIRASDGFHLWSQTYDRKPEEVIALQEELAIKIATALKTAMDPEALARMVSSGTNSVPAYNAYLQGLAYGLSTASTGDAYELISARDAFEQAVQLDPEFALAHWELANFWIAQLGSTFAMAGMLELSRDDMRSRYEAAIENAIQFEQDPISKNRYRAQLAADSQQRPRALRLNAEYLRQRPNDWEAQLLRMDLLVDMSMDDELKEAIIEYQENDGHNVLISTNAMTYSLISDDKPFIRALAQESMRRLGDNVFVAYQAHRSLLWAGDIDGASPLQSVIETSDMPEDSKNLVALRQACAENKISDATRIYDYMAEAFGDDLSMVVISNYIMGNKSKAIEALRMLDNKEGLEQLEDYLSYAYFDVSQFPYLTAYLESQGVEPRVPLEIPYSCKT
jgi:TolB-like protein